MEFKSVLVFMVTLTSFCLQRTSCDVHIRPFHLLPKYGPSKSLYSKALTRLASKPSHDFYGLRSGGKQPLLGASKDKSNIFWSRLFPGLRSFAVQEPVPHVGRMIGVVSGLRKKRVPAASSSSTGPPWLTGMPSQQINGSPLANHSDYPEGNITEAEDVTSTDSELNEGLTEPTDDIESSKESEMPWFFRLILHPFETLNSTGFVRKMLSLERPAVSSENSLSYIDDKSIASPSFDVDPVPTSLEGDLSTPIANDTHTHHSALPYKLRHKRSASSSSVTNSHSLEKSTLAGLSVLSSTTSPVTVTGNPLKASTDHDSKLSSTSQPPAVSSALLGQTSAASSTTLKSTNHDFLSRTTLGAEMRTPSISVAPVTGFVRGSQQTVTSAPVTASVESVKGSSSAANVPYATVTSTVAANVPAATSTVNTNAAVTSVPVTTSTVGRNAASTSAPATASTISKNDPSNNAPSVTNAPTTTSSGSKNTATANFSVRGSTVSLNANVTSAPIITTTSHRVPSVTNALTTGSTVSRNAPSSNAPLTTSSGTKITVATSIPVRASTGSLSANATSAPVITTTNHRVASVTNSPTTASTVTKNPPSSNVPTTTSSGSKITDATNAPVITTISQRISSVTNAPTTASNVSKNTSSGNAPATTSSGSKNMATTSIPVRASIVSSSATVTNAAVITTTSYRTATTKNAPATTTARSKNANGTSTAGTLVSVSTSSHTTTTNAPITTAVIRNNATTSSTSAMANAVSRNVSATNVPITASTASRTSATRNVPATMSTAGRNEVTTNAPATGSTISKTGSVTSNSVRTNAAITSTPTTFSTVSRNAATSRASVAGSTITSSAFATNPPTTRTGSMNVSAANVPVATSTTRKNAATTIASATVRYISNGSTTTSTAKANSAITSAPFTFSTTSSINAATTNVPPRAENMIATNPPTASTIFGKNTAASSAATSFATRTITQSSSGARISLTSSFGTATRNGTTPAVSVTSTTRISGGHTLTTAPSGTATGSVTSSRPATESVVMTISPSRTTSELPTSNMSSGRVTVSSRMPTVNVFTTSPVPLTSSSTRASVGMNSSVNGVTEEVCRTNEVFCLKTKKCIPNYNYYDLETGSWSEGAGCSGTEVVCEPNGICRMIDCKHGEYRKHFCSISEVFCLATGFCVKCLSAPENEYQTEFPEFPHTTESPVRMPEKTHMCPRGEIYPLPVTVYCREDDDCPLSSQCCYISEEEKNKLPYCVWIAQNGACPSFMHFCNETSKCLVPTEPCNNTCLSTWEYCAAFNQCVEAGTCKSQSENYTQYTLTPFELPNTLSPVLKVKTLGPAMEDEFLEFKVSDVFSVIGASDYPITDKEKFLLKFMKEHLHWELDKIEYYGWIANFSAFLSVKGSAVEVVAIDTKSKVNDLASDPAAAFPCEDNAMLQVMDKNNNQSWRHYCNINGLHLRLHYKVQVLCKPNFNGIVLLHVAPYVIDILGNKNYGQIQDVTLEVLPVNDPPSLRLDMANIDSEIPYITAAPLDSIHYHDQGTLVKDLVSAYFHEPDGEEMGMAVVSAQVSNLGFFQYSLPGGEWLDLTSIDSSCSILKHLNITDAHQGVVLIDGLHLRSDQAENNYRVRRDLSFVEDVSTIDTISVDSGSHPHPLSALSQANFQAFYSKDFMALSDLALQEESPDNGGTTHSFNVSSFDDLLLDVPWRIRRSADLLPKLDCSIRPTVAPVSLLGSTTLNPATTSWSQAATTFKLDPISVTELGLTTPRHVPTPSHLVLTTNPSTTSDPLSKVGSTTSEVFSTGRNTQKTPAEMIPTSTRRYSDHEPALFSSSSQTPRTPASFSSTFLAPGATAGVPFIPPEVTSVKTTKSSLDVHPSTVNSVSRDAVVISSNTPQPPTVSTSKFVSTRNPNFVSSSTVRSPPMTTFTGPTPSSFTRHTSFSSSVSPISPTGSSHVGTEGPGSVLSTRHGNADPGTRIPGWEITNLGTDQSIIYTTRTTPKFDQSTNPSTKMTEQGVTVSGTTHSPGWTTTDPRSSPNFGHSTNPSTRMTGQGITVSGTVQSTDWSTNDQRSTFSPSTTKPLDQYEDKEQRISPFLEINATVMFLPPTARLRFVRHNSSSTTAWFSILDAMSGSKLTFLGWDSSVRKNPGEKQNLTLRLCTVQNERCSSNGSLSSHMVVVHRRPQDCSSQPSLLTPRKQDACGVCGGRGESCLDCNGDLNGDAIMDCNVCVGGMTKKKQKSTRDCDGQCNKPNIFVVDDDGCELFKNNKFQHCNHKSNSSFVDECGICQDGHKSSPMALTSDSHDVSNCGHCRNLMDSNKMIEHYEHFNCDEKWKFGLMTEAIGFGSHPHLNWEKRPNIGSTVFLDLAAYRSSTFSVHIYGPSWSYKSNIYSNVSCDLLDFTGRPMSVIVSYLLEDRLQMDVPYVSPGDYHIDCQLMLPPDKFHRLAPVSKLTICDSRQIWIEDWSPNVIQVNKNVTVTLNGENFVNSPDLSCFYVQHPSKFAEPLCSAEYVNDKRVLCHIPSGVFSEVTAVGIGVVISSLTLQQYNMGQIMTLSTASVAIVNDDAIPHLLSATVFHDLQSIVAQFSCNIHCKRCTHVFDDFGKLYRTSLSCYCRADAFILKTDVALKPLLGTKLRMSDDNSVTCSGSIMGRNAVGEAIIRESQTKADLNFGLIGPNQVCGNKGTYRITSLRGISIENVVISWRLQFKSNSSSNSTQRDKLTELVEGLPKTTTEFSFTPQMLEPHLNYSLTITVFQDFQQKYSKSINFTFIPTNFISLIISGPSRVHPQNKVQLTASATLCPAYVDSRLPQFSFYWEMDGSNLDLWNVRSNVLIIEKGSLQGGRRYVIRCLVILNGDPTKSSVAEFVFETLLGDPIATVSVTRLSVPVHHQFQLNGELSYDPFLTPSHLLMYSWSCRTPSNSGCYSVISNKIQLFEDLMNSSLQVPVLNVDGHLLTVGEYIFKLTVKTTDGRESSTEAYVEIIPKKQAPVISIVRGSQSEITPSRKVPLQSFITAPAGTELFLKGTMAVGCLFFDVTSSKSVGWYRVLDSSVMDVPFSFTLNPHTPSSSTDSIVSNLLPGSCYKLRLTAKHPLQGTTYADVVLKTASLPTFSHIFQVSPTLGTAIFTEFFVDISGVVKNEQDCIVHVGYASLHTSEKIQYLRQYVSPFGSLTGVRLPAVNNTSGHLYVIISICSSAGECLHRKSKPIEVLTPRLGSKEQLEDVVKTITAIVDEGDLLYALHHAASCIDTFKMADITHGGTLQRITYIAEMIVQRLMARINMRIDDGYSSREEAFTVMSAASSIFTKFHPSKRTLASLLMLQTKMIDCFVRHCTMSEKNTGGDVDHDRATIVDSVSTTSTYGMSMRMQVSANATVGRTPSWSSTEGFVTTSKFLSEAITVSSVKTSTASGLSTAIPYSSSPLHHSTTRLAELPTKASAQGLLSASILQKRMSRPSEPLTTKQAETLFAVTDVALNATNYSAVLFKQLLRDLPDLWMAMCLGAMPNSEPVQAFSQQLSLQVTNFDIEKSWDQKAYPFVDASTDAKNFVKVLSYFQFIAAPDFSSEMMQCEDHKADCGTVCLGSAHIKSQPFSTVLSPGLMPNSLRRGDILTIWPVLHSSGEDWNLLDFSSTINLNISVNKEDVTLSEIPYLKCAAWQSGDNYFDTGLCNTLRMIENPSAFRVECTCIPTRFYTLYLDQTSPPMKSTEEVTTSSPTVMPSRTRQTSTSVTVTSTMSTSDMTTKMSTSDMTTKIITVRSHASGSVDTNGPLGPFYIISFIISEEYNEHVRNAKVFISIMLQQFCILLDVPLSTFHGVEVTPGSIKVKMQVYPDPQGKYGDGPELVNHIHDLIDAGQFCFQGENNETLCAQKGSYSLNTSPEAIAQQFTQMVGLVVGLVFGVVILCIGLCVARAICKSKRKKTVVQPSPEAIPPWMTTYQEMHMPPTDVALLEGTIDSRQHYHMKLTSNPPSPYHQPTSSSLLCDSVPNVPQQSDGIAQKQILLPSQLDTSTLTPLEGPPTLPHQAPPPPESVPPSSSSNAQVPSTEPQPPVALNVTPGSQA